MTGKEYHKLMGLVGHFRQRAKEWAEDRDRETNQMSKCMSDGKVTAYGQAADDVEKLLEEMNT